MWISVPTPVITSSITDESWSTWRATSILSVPAAIQDQYVSTYGWVGGDAATPPTTPSATTNEAASTPTPMILTARLASGRKKLNQPLARNPANGSSTTIQAQPTAFGIYPRRRGLKW